MDQGQHSRDKLKRKCVKKKKKLNYGTHICGDDRNIKVLGWKISKVVCYWGCKILVLATKEVSKSDLGSSHSAYSLNMLKLRQFDDLHCASLSRMYLRYPI